MTVFEQVKKVIVDEMNIDESKVTMETDLERDLHMDSIDAVEMIVALEDAFDTSISDDDAQGLKTVKDLVDYIEAHK